jgi:hypothetical protein
VIDDKKITIWRHLIHEFSFITFDGKRNGRRTSLSGTSMIYGCLLTSKTLLGYRCITTGHTFLAIAGIRAAIPLVIWVLTKLESRHLSESPAKGDDELRLLDPQEVTLDTSLAQRQITFKKPKR